jgi:mono/diheme cytochrome c family protein
MYHGIIQESNWTKPGSYLRPQILRKKLDQNIGRGRIYRLVHDGYTPGPQPHLLEATSMELVDGLSNANGWWRDNAQELLVIRQDSSVVPALKQLARGEQTFVEKWIRWKKAPSPLTRTLALWTLEGLHSVDQDLLLASLGDKDPEVRKAAVRIGESFLAAHDQAILKRTIALAGDSSADVRIQVALSLRYSKQPEARDALAGLIKQNPDNELLVRSATRSLQEGDPDMIALKARTARMNYGDKHLLNTGVTNFKQLCASCHGLRGEGLPSQVAPPLAGAAEVNGDPALLIRLLLNGLTGPVAGKDYGVMPAQVANNDEYIASVLSYIRNSMGNNATLIHPADVRAIRSSDTARHTSWTLKELHSLRH